MALIPGLGYAYTGHYQTAIAALLVNGLTMAATKEAIDHHRPGFATITSLFAFGWYSGSIYGSVASAERFNRFAVDRFMEHFPPLEAPSFEP
jgi:hypothetical protein